MVRLYKELETLRTIINQEKTFQLQIFTMESFDVIEKWLNKCQIKYKKVFTSQYSENVRDLVVLLRDNDDFEVFSDSRVVLFSNERDRRFVPYRFAFTDDEKARYVTDAHSKKMSLCSLNRKKIDVPEYIAKSLTRIQCIIIFCLVRESRFDKLVDEIKAVDSDLKNKTQIKMEINELMKTKILMKRGDVYKLNVSNEVVKKVCDKIGFGKVLD